MNLGGRSNLNHDVPTYYFPDTHQPVPVVLTVEEVVRLLRLNEVGIKHPKRTIERYRKLGLLRAVLISRRIMFYLIDVLAFIERQREANPR